MYETWQECAKREVSEETDLELEEMTFGHVTNDPMVSENKHYVTIFMLATCKGETRPKTMEPNKCEGWSSYSWEELEDLQAQGKLFGPLDRLVQEKPKAIVEFLG
jgi:8-oxo-dGTP diphosphatase